MTIITLLTDFGLKDGNIGAMKGVIWSIAHGVSIADISHQITHQNIQEAALVLVRAAPYFPDGTVHTVVVDPGVGTSRRPIAAKLGAQFFVGPDNGVITRLLERTEKMGQPVSFFHLNHPQFWLQDVSNVFHGRDIFSPIAAHLANGVDLNNLGELIENPIRIKLPEPARTSWGYTTEVIHIDHFGNLTTSMRREMIASETISHTRIGGMDIHGLAKTFGDFPPGKLVALYGSHGDLIISVVNGSAQNLLDAKVGDPVKVFLKG